MKLSEYLRKRCEVEKEDCRWQKEAERIANTLLEENAKEGGGKYPTTDSLWKEAISRAEKEEKGGVQ